MSDLLGPHIGHHIIATIAVKKLLLGWDADKQMPIWSDEAPHILREEIIKWVADHAEDQYDS